MVVVIAWIQLEHCVNALTAIEGMNLFCILSDTPQDLVSRFALLIAQRKVHVFWMALRFMREEVLLIYSAGLSCRIA